MQVHLSNGLPTMAIVGLADKAVGESRECVRAALSSLGLALPAKRIVVNLSPADIGKEGAHFDLLPPLSACEALEVTVIHSIIGKVPKGGLCQKCPFREPHHFASMAALVRGGQKAMPGEILPAHNGVLFLDELAEFNRVAIDSLKQPLETGEFIIARAFLNQI